MIYFSDDWIRFKTIYTLRFLHITTILTTKVLTHYKYLANVTFLPSLPLPTIKQQWVLIPGFKGMQLFSFAINFYTLHRCKSCKILIYWLNPLEWMVECFTHLVKVGKCCKLQDEHINLNKKPGLRFLWLFHIHDVVLFVTGQVDIRLLILNLHRCPHQSKNFERGKSLMRF